MKVWVTKISLSRTSNPAVLHGYHGKPHTDIKTLKDFVSEVKSNLRGEILALMGEGVRIPNEIIQQLEESSTKRRFIPVQLVG